MNTMTLDTQINRAAFWAAIATLVAGIAALFLPLDAPAGPLQDRIVWLNSNSGAFIAGWIVQIGAMFARSAVFAGAAWQIANEHPLRALLGALTVLISVVAFIIPKFIAIGSIPLMAAAATSGSTGHDIAETLINLLHPSIPFTLFTSFDYLGFWLYAVFGLMVAGPLFRLTRGAKVAAISLGLFGLAFHAMLIGVLTGMIPQDDIELYSSSSMGALLFAVVGMAFHFKSVMSAKM
jgi:hypothetical protein